MDSRQSDCRLLPWSVDKSPAGSLGRKSWQGRSFSSAMDENVVVTMLLGRRTCRRFCPGVNLKSLASPQDNDVGGPPVKGQVGGGTRCELALCCVSARSQSAKATGTLSLTGYAANGVRGLGSHP